MRHFLFLTTTFFLLILSACKTEKKNEATVAEPETVKELSILEKVAQAHGYDQWKTVQKLEFTFNVDRGTEETTHYERSWAWETKANIVSQDTIRYHRNELTPDSPEYRVNGGFVNDKYWLLAPFNLIWDKDNFTYEHSTEATAPISAESMQKLTIVYSNEGGYTPGDAYDFYFGDDYLVKEWVFRKANQEEANLATTWEAYEDFGGIPMATMHKNAEGTFKLYFTNIKTETKS
ncbi:hypothetical protein [Spongiimicrobium salis]|uniref:hypothetical protein n=1 Tax=Spongiimicrobium salis TaxID=1667022 RepID=UPI00374D8ADB